jgi:hypothetical protein
MLLDEQPSPIQIAIWRGMSSERRMQLLGLLDNSLRALKAAGIQAQHPNWSDERMNTEVRRIISRVDPEFYFEGILPMFTACGERFDRPMMVDWLQQHGIESESNRIRR